MILTRFILLMAIACLFPLLSHSQARLKIDKPAGDLIEIKYHVLDHNENIKTGSYQYFFGTVLLTKGVYLNNKKNGQWRFISADGHLNFMGNYLNDIKVGIWLYKRFGIKFAAIHYDSQGDVISHYKFYPNGDTSFKMKRYVQDQDTFDVENTYYPSGKIFDSRTIIHHTAYDTMYYTNGSIKLIFEEKDKKKKFIKYLDSLGNMLPVDSVFLSKLSSKRTDSIVERMPKFPGGQKVFNGYLTDVMHEVGGKKGRLLVQFVIDKNGYVKDAKITKHLSRAADKEALRVINLMPRWSPGMQNGLPVTVQYSLPFNFK